MPTTVLETCFTRFGNSTQRGENAPAHLRPVQRVGRRARDRAQVEGPPESSAAGLRWGWACVSNRSSGDAGATGAAAVSVCVGGGGGVCNRGGRESPHLEVRGDGLWRAGVHRLCLTEAHRRAGGREYKRDHQAVLSRHKAKCPGEQRKAWSAFLSPRSTGRILLADVSGHSARKEA